MYVVYMRDHFFKQLLRIDRSYTNIETKTNSGNLNKMYL